MFSIDFHLDFNENISHFFMHKKFEKLKLKSFGSIQKIINKKTKVLDKFGYVVAQIKIKHMIS